MLPGFLARGGLAAFLALASTTAVLADNTGTTTDRLVKIPVPGNPLRAFDIGWVDPSFAKYYLADRSNGAIDIFSTQFNSFVGRIGGFVGATGKNNTSGPNGVVVTVPGRELWAGDGDSSLKVVDLAGGQIVASIPTGGKMRADELAYDPQHNEILIANDADDPPFLSLVSVGDRSVLKKVEIPDATDGIEQSVFDPGSGVFDVAVPETTANEGGEIFVFDPVSMQVTSRFPLPDCKPHGLALGPGHNLIAGCSKPSRTLVVDGSSGKVLAEFNQTGGSDQVTFNSGENRYYLAENAAQNVGVIDARTNTFVENVESGLGAHSIASDPVRNHIFVPIAAPDPACPTGCIAVFASVRGDRGDIAP